MEFFFSVGLIFRECDGVFFFQIFYGYGYKERSEYFIVFYFFKEIGVYYNIIGCIVLFICNQRVDFVIKLVYYCKIDFII